MVLHDSFFVKTPESRIIIDRMQIKLKPNFIFSSMKKQLSLIYSKFQVYIILYDLYIT